MTQLLVDTLGRLPVSIDFVDKGLSLSMTEMGRFRFGKIPRALRSVWKTMRTAATHRHDFAIFLLTVSGASFALDFFLISILRLFQVRYVLYLHGRGYRDLARRSTLGRLAAVFVFSKALRIVMLSERLFEDISEFASRSKVTFIPNALPSESPSAREAPVPDKLVRFLFLSNFSHDKGATEVLRLAQRTRDLEGTIHYTLAGGIPDPTYFAELQRFVEAENLKGLVSLKGPAHGAEKNLLFASSDVFLFPTSFRYETFGLVNLEAMAASLPIIASDLGGIPDVVSEGETGFVIPTSRLDLWEEKIRLLTSDCGLRQRLGRAGLQRYQTLFTVDVFRSRWEKTIAEVRDEIAGGARARLQTHGRER